MISATLTVTGFDVLGKRGTVSSWLLEPCSLFFGAVMYLPPFREFLAGCRTPSPTESTSSCSSDFPQPVIVNAA
jgi:hypothetical protein